MIQGATIRCASAIRTAAEQTTIAPSQTQARHRDGACPNRFAPRSPARAAHTSPASRARRTSSEASSRPTSAAASAIRQSTASATASPPAASSSAAHVGGGDAVQVVLARDVGAGGRAERVPVVGGELERAGDRRHLVLVDRDLQRDAVRQLGEPADVGHEHRLAERERRGSPRPRSRPSSASAG